MNKIQDSENYNSLQSGFKEMLKMKIKIGLVAEWSSKYGLTS